MDSTRARHELPAAPTGARAPSAWCSSPGLIAVVAAAVVMLGVAAESVIALAIVVMEGGLAMGTLAAAGLAGGWIVRAVGLGRAPLAERLVVGVALGVGCLSLVTLGLGSAGWLSRPVAIGMVVVVGLAGLWRLALDLRGGSAGEDARAMSSTLGPHGLKPTAQVTPAGWAWLWLAVCPFLVIALLAACLPPGVLWEEEGFGYDVLEYHLAVPKEFHQAGCIHFLPHNVYSNFPLNGEMLSLLMMTLKGDAIEAAFAAQLVNVGLAALFVAAAWLAGRAHSPRAGLLAGVLAGTLGWVPYLAGIAYVEPGMLAMGMTCLLAVRESTNRCGEAQPAGHAENVSPTAFLGGLLGGLAGGFKYTALPLMVLPAGALLVWLHPGSWRRRGVRLLLFAAGAAVTFSPWMLRNMINTGDPVFPLGHDVFGARADTWDDELDARWAYAHGPAGAGEPEVSAVRRLVRHTVADPRMGVVIFVLAAVGAWRVHDRWTAGLLAMLVWQVVFWLTFTHQYARFAVLMLIPLILLASRAVASPGGAFRANGRQSAGLVFGLLAAGSMLGLYPLARLFHDHTRPGGEPVHAYGHTDWFTQGQWPGTAPIGALNALPDDASAMLVGEARTFYLRRPCEYATVFNHHPLAGAAGRAADAASVLAWLGERGTTHLLVHWQEIRRLRGSYGFYPEITAELFEGLVEAGLAESAVFAWSEDALPYATLFEVPQHE